MLVHYSHRKSGFTMIEVLTVVAIIGVLTSVVITGTTEARQRSRDARRISDIATIQLAVEQYRDICRQYPATLALGASNGCTGGLTLESFLPTIPTSPAPGSYTYKAYSSNTRYVIGATLETNDRALTDDIDGTIDTTVNCNDLVYCKGN